MVSLEIDEHGNIVGPQLPPNSSPPSKVFHPIAGIGYLQPELSVSVVIPLSLTTFRMTPRHLSGTVRKNPIGMFSFVKPEP